MLTQRNSSPNPDRLLDDISGFTPHTMFDLRKIYLARGSFLGLIAVGVNAEDALGMAFSQQADVASFFLAYPARCNISPMTDKVLASSIVAGIL